MDELGGSGVGSSKAALSWEQCATDGELLP